MKLHQILTKSKHEHGVLKNLKPVFLHLHIYEFKKKHYKSKLFSKFKYLFSIFIYFRNEININRIIKEKLKNKTILTIAHRLNNIKDYDKIMVNIFNKKF